MKRVLVALDLSENSKYALKWTLENFVTEEDEVVLVQSFQVPVSTVVLAPEVDLVLDAQSDTYRSELTSAAEDNLRMIAEEMVEPRKIKYDIRVEEGDARDIIPAVAKDERVAAVVVGSRGMGAVKRMLLGSVSDSVVHSCTCPVVVVHME